MENHSFLIYGKHFRQFYYQEFQTLCADMRYHSLR